MTLLLFAIFSSPTPEEIIRHYEACKAVREERIIQCETKFCRNKGEDCKQELRAKIKKCITYGVRKVGCTMGRERIGGQEI